MLSKILLSSMKPFCLVNPSRHSLKPKLSTYIRIILITSVHWQCIKKKKKVPLPVPPPPLRSVHSAKLARVRLRGGPEQRRVHASLQPAPGPAQLQLRLGGYLDGWPDGALDCRGALDCHGALGCRRPRVLTHLVRPWRFW